MKPFTIFTLAALMAAAALVAGSYGQGNGSKPTGTAGRYQLVTGRVTHRDLNVSTNVTMSSEEPVIMKIDTSTGETWILEYRSTGPGMIAGDTRNHVFFTPDSWSQVKEFDLKSITDMGPIPAK